MQNFNLERTRAPRRNIPWWIYAGAVIVACLLIWAVVKVLPGRKAVEDEAQAQSDPLPPAEIEETKTVSPVSTPALPTTPAARADSPSAPITQSNPPTTPATQPQLLDALAAKNSGNLLEARKIALGIWKTSDSADVKNSAEAILNEVNIELVLTPRVMDEKVDYTVVSGDSLEKIAKKFDTTIELIRKSNNIQGSLIRAGDRLRIFQGKFSVTVSKSNNDLVLYMNNDFFKRYQVGTGAYNKTPVGDFQINDRIAQPTWWRPDGKSIPYGDPENLLGTHWLSINVKGYGLHGTWEPDTIGKQASAGCVRMLNDDIEQLFSLLTIGTPVSIRD